MNATAEFLFALRRDRRREDALPKALRLSGLDAGYTAQALLVEKLCQLRATAPSGYKIALTNPAAQALLGVSHPVFGRLLAGTSHVSGVELAADDFTTRVVEVEFAFTLRADIPLNGVPLTAESIKSYVGSVHPAIEIVDYRFATLDCFDAATLAADNAIHGAFVLGNPIGGWESLDLANCAAVLRVNGEAKLSGAGDRALGNPLSALAWLATAVPDYGLRLSAGEVVTTGLLTDGIYEARAGDVLIGDFGDLGQVSLSFT